MVIVLLSYSALLSLFSLMVQFSKITGTFQSFEKSINPRTV
jgi:hypothetical protein